jgi:hypothetical protein
MLLKQNKGNLGNFVAVYSYKSFDNSKYITTSNKYNKTVSKQVDVLGFSPSTNYEKGYFQILERGRKN